MKTSILVYLMFVLVQESLGFIMTCPELDEDSESCDENMAWMCEHITWRNKLAYWKRRVEKKCFVSNAEEYWRLAFTCPDFSEIRCVDDFYRHTEYDLFQCPITFCINGKYQDVKMLRRIWRQHMMAYKKIMNIYVSKLGNCGDCLNMDISTPGTPNPTFATDEYQDPVTTPYEPITTFEKCAKSITVTSISSGALYDGCKTSPSGGCFWVELRDPWSFTYSEAAAVCQAHDSELAVIPNEETYQIIVDGVKQLTSYAWMWLGMTIDPTTMQVCPLGSFDKYWYSNAPHSSVTETKIALVASKSNYTYDYGMSFEGLINYSPEAGGLHGAICWKPMSPTTGYQEITPTPQPIITTDATPECHENITDQPIHKGNISDDCKTSPVGECFWLELGNPWSVDFYEAESTCAAHDSVLAVIPDEDTYDQIKDAVANVTSYAVLWLGMTVNPLTNQTCPVGSFDKYWYSTAPFPFYMDTKVALVATTASANFLDGSCAYLGKCCPGQDNSCHTFHGPKCFCDEYCVTAKDCCSDYILICGEPAATSSTTDDTSTAAAILTGFDSTTASSTEVPGGSSETSARPSYTTRSMTTDVTNQNTVQNGSPSIAQTGVIYDSTTNDPSSAVGSSMPDQAYPYQTSTAPEDIQQNFSNPLNISVSGLLNKKPTSKAYGVVCWKPKKAPTDETTSSYSSTLKPAASTPTVTVNTPGCTKIVTDDTAQFGPVSDSCKYNTAGGCFWTEMGYYNVTQAAELCASHKSDLAVIPDEKTYTDIATNIGQKYKGGWGGRYWLGNTYDTTSMEPCPKNAYYTWSTTDANVLDPRYTQLSIYVYTNGTMVTNTFMRNTPMPSYTVHGVVCWKKSKELGHYDM